MSKMDEMDVGSELEEKPDFEPHLWIRFVYITA